jgi:transcription elongation factor GreA
MVDTGGGTSGTAAIGGAALIRAAGLDADGPVLWGAPVSSRVPGVLVVELPQPSPSAPIDTVALRRWIEGVPTLRMDDRRPTVNELAARLNAFWLPEQTVLYIGYAEKSLGGRVAALYGTDLGQRRPHPGGHWLRTLRGIAKARVWWAETDAAEEYADALFSAFAAAVDPARAARLHDPSIVLPFANRENASGGKKSHGIAGFLLPDDGPRPFVGTGAQRRLPDAAAEGAAETRPRPAAGPPPTARRPRALSDLSGPRRVAPRPTTPRAAATPGRQMPAREVVSAEGLERLRGELDDLVNVQRPQVIERVKNARELGDLRENADYEAARNEQSFLEGRIQTIRARLDNAEVAGTAGSTEGGVVVGSTVIVEDEGERSTYILVGAGEADPASGRISYASPVGRALIGARPGDEVTAALPGRELRLRIIEVS